MKIEILLYIGGIFHLIWALFDMSWTRLFKWKETLAPLDDVNRVLLPILNKLLVVIFLAFAYISFFHTSELINTDVGTTLLLFIIIFWIVRTIEQLYYFRFSQVDKLNVSVSSFAPFFPFNKMSNRGILYYYFFIVFILMIALYLVPLVYKIV